MRCTNLQRHRCKHRIKIRCETDGGICGYINIKERPTELYNAFPEWILEESE